MCAVVSVRGFACGTPGKTRTCIQRFWRPRLYHLSYRRSACFARLRPDGARVLWTVVRQLAPWRRTTVKQYHDQRTPVKREAKMCEQHSYSDCVRLGGSAISFATATTATIKALMGNRRGDGV